MLAEKAVVSESVEKEPVALGAYLLDAALIPVAQERRGHSEVRIHGVAQRLTFVFQYFVVILHPLPRFFGRHKRERQRPHAQLRGLNNGLTARARHPQRRVRLLQGFRNNVARGHFQVLALITGERIFHQHADRYAHAFQLHVLFLGLWDVETSQPVSVAPAPVPNSTRPSLSKSSVAMRSAIRAGWLMYGGVCTMPWPMRTFLVRWLTAARNTSGAEECAYSSRK